MKTVLDEPKVEKGAEARTACAGCCAHDAQELAKKFEKRVAGAKAAVSEKLEDGKLAAERLVKRGRYAVEDGILETAHNIKRHPFGTLAIAFAVGAAVGFLAPRATRK